MFKLGRSCPLIASAYAHMERWKKAFTFHKRVKISSLRNRIGRMREWSPWSSGYVISRNKGFGHDVSRLLRLYWDGLSRPQFSDCCLRSAGFGQV